MRVRQLWPALLSALVVLAAIAVLVHGVAPELGAHPCDRHDVPMPTDVVHPPPDPASPLVGSWAGLWGGNRASRLVVRSVADGEADLTYGIVPWGDGVGPYRGGFHRERVSVGPDGRSVGWGPLSFRFDPPSDTLLGTFVETGQLGGTVVMSRCTGTP